MVVKTPENVISVEPGVEELRDEWGRRWVVLRDERRGLKREHYLPLRSERTTEVEVAAAATSTATSASGSTAGPSVDGSLAMGSR